MPPPDGGAFDPEAIPHEEEFLQELNDELLEFDRTLTPRHPAGGPGLFIFGVPRSGTTLLYQLVAFCFDAGYISNVAARFWRVPLVGIRLSEALEVDDHPPFASRAGRTRGATGPHEFGYFWSRLFGYEGQQVRPEGAVEDWRWEAIEREVGRIHREFGRPVVHKNLTYAFHLPRFRRVFPDAVFLYLERDLADTGLSILATRETLHDDRTRWWSVEPRNGGIRERDLSPEREVAEQIAALRERWEQGLKTVPEERVLRLRYRDLCRAPSGILDQIAGTVNRRGGRLTRVREPPDRFEVRRRSDDPARRAMASALDAAGTG